MLKTSRAVCTISPDDSSQIMLATEFWPSDFIVAKEQKKNFCIFFFSKREQGKLQTRIMFQPDDSALFAICSLSKMTAALSAPD